MFPRASGLPLASFAVPDNAKSITDLIKEGQIRLRKVESMPPRPPRAAADDGGPDLVVALRNAQSGVNLHPSGGRSPSVCSGERLLTAETGWLELPRHLPVCQFAILRRAQDLLWNLGGGLLA